MCAHNHVLLNSAIFTAEAQGYGVFKGSPEPRSHG
jgi:hypothetical protein